MAESSPKQTTFKVQRYNPEVSSPPYFQELTVPFRGYDRARWPFIHKRKSG